MQDAVSACAEPAWDRKRTRVKFEEKLLAESERLRAPDETDLDILWIVCEYAIAEVLAHLPADGDGCACEGRLPANAAKMTEVAIIEACRACGFPLGDFENQRKSMAARGFACAILRVKLPMGTVVQMLDRSTKRLRQAMRRITDGQLQRAREIGAKLKPEWKTDNGH
jgi:hypothetical protein